MNGIRAGADALPAALLIGGSLLTTASGGTFDHVNPATGKAQRTIPLAGTAEVDAAVAVARSAFAQWRGWPPDQRRRALTRLADLMREHAAELATIQALENGIPRTMAESVMVPKGADWTEYAASWADKLAGEVVPTAPDSLDYTLAEPVGVVAVIMTWNGPVSSFGMCVAPPLAAGCCVVVKSSELAPFSSLLLGQLCEQAGLPPGVVNVLPGTAEAGAALVGHPGVDKVSFTGGGAARRIAVGCAQRLKPVLLELGGKSANVVFDDADLTKAAASAATIAGLAGQGCTLPSRLLVQDGVYDQLAGLVSDRLERIAVGDPFDSRTVMGPVISEAAADRILGMVQRASGTVLTGGKRLGGELADGFFVAPTAIGDVDPASEIAQAEVFGPVVAITRFRDEDEAIELANGTRYGLAAYLHTRDVSRVHRMAAALDAGTVGVNGARAPAGPGAPFGGVKESGYGREGGRAGIAEFQCVKNVLIDLT